MSGAPSTQLQQALYAVGDSLRRGEIARAMELSEQAIAQGLEDASLLTLAGQRRLRAGMPQDALAPLVRAREIAPGKIEGLDTLGVCLTQLGRGPEAVRVFDEALAVAPQVASLHLHKAQTLEETGTLHKAQAVLEELLVLEPGNAQALARLAVLAARRGDTAAARDFAARVLAVEPLPAATIALAMADLQDKLFDAARDRLSVLLADARMSPIDMSVAQGLMGDALDGLDRPDKAFASYATSRETLRQATTGLLHGREGGLARVRRIDSYFRSAPLKYWQAKAKGAAPAVTHVFLVGFPGSGTALLARALAGYRDVQILEDADCFADTLRVFVDRPGGLVHFAALDEAEIQRCRAAYWKRVNEAGCKPERSVFIDKMPLNILHLGLVARLFPYAKILFAQRDPRDVAFSCFRRRLVLSAQTYELTGLDSAATFYAAVMDLAQFYRDKLGLAIFDSKHEELLADFAGGMQKICDFLGLAHEGESEPLNNLENVPGLNQASAGRWRRYRAQLEPVLPILTPWIDRFGYKES